MAARTARWIVTMLTVALLPSPTPANPPAPGTPVSLTPLVTISGGTPAQHQRVDLAVARFRDAGLLLPDLEVVLSPTTTACHGHHGLFTRQTTPWRVTICSELGFVHEHELAHAWEAATLRDEQRRAFMRLRGHTAWSDPALPWDERGMEAAAFVIQQALGGPRLPRMLSAEQSSRLVSYRVLTGREDPRLARWRGQDAGRPCRPGPRAPAGIASTVLG